MTSFWWLFVFLIDLFFISSLRSVICKKYANSHGKDSKYTKAIVLVAVLVTLVVSLLALFLSLLPFFASFKILYFNLSM